MSNIQDELPCPICGNTSYSWGNVSAQSLGYFPQDAGFWDKWSSPQKIPARKCESCGNIQLFSQDFVGEK